MAAETRPDFELANRAYEQFTPAERLRALAVFVRLRYPSIEDRFFEAVHSVIREAEGTRD